MTSKHSLFLITSRRSFIDEAERAAGTALGAIIAGTAAMSESAAAPAGVAALRSSNASAILVDLDSGLAEGLRTLQDLCKSTPEARVFVASSERDPDVILQVMRAGAADFLPLPLDDQSLANALARNGRTAGGGDTLQPGRVLSFLSAKGGCGATTVAVNVAVGLAGSGPGRSVIILDLDSPGGDVTAMLKLKPVYSLSDVAASTHRLDSDLLNGVVVTHESGVKCLAAAGEGENPGTVTAQQLVDIVTFLRGQFDEVVLAGCGAGEVEMASVSQAHMVHLVTTVDFLALKRAQQAIGRLRQFGVEGDALRVIVNRHDKSSDLTLHDVRRALDAPMVLALPSDPRGAERAVNEGVPVVSKGRSRLQATFLEYAAQLTRGDQSESSSGGVGRLFRRLVPGRAVTT